MRKDVGLGVEEPNEAKDSSLEVEDKELIVDAGACAGTGDIDDPTMVGEVGRTLTGAP